MKNFPNAVHYHYNKFPPKNLDYKRLAKPLRTAATTLARYDQMLMSMHNSEILLAPLRSREAVISSKIEGTISTLDDVLNYEADTKQVSANNAETYNKHDAQEVSLYGRAMKEAQEALQKGVPLNSFLLRQIHQILLSSGRGANKSPGSFKTQQNYLGKNIHEVSFVPISPELLKEGIDRLFTYIAADDSDELIKTAIAHVEFESLHPFEDGNGRIGRMLITLLLWQFKLISAPCFYISDYFEQNRAEYTELMRNVSQHGAWTEWTEFFLQALERQAHVNLAKATQIKTLYEDLKTRFIDILNSKWSINALDFLFTQPIFDNNIFSDETVSGIPKTTAVGFTPQLVKHGFLKTLREGVGRRPARYSFEPLMQILRT